jgi:hypothetical protein
MKKYPGSFVSVILLIAWMLLNYWSVFAPALDSLRASGASGSFLAKIILSPMFALLLGTAAVALAYKGISNAGQKGGTAPSVPQPIENKIEDRSRIDVSPNFSPTFSPTFSPQVLVGSPDKVVAPKIEKEDSDESPSLSFLKAEEVLLHQTQIGTWYEASTELQSAVRGLVAPFKNVPKGIGERTPKASSVTASMVFRNVERSDEMHINHGVWLQHYEHFATFRSGETQYLLIAVKTIPYVTFDNPHTHNPFKSRWRSGMSVSPPQAMTLWNEGEVEITLVDSWGVTLFHGVFDYKLSADEMILTQRQPRQSP